MKPGVSNTDDFMQSASEAVSDAPDANMMVDAPVDYVSRAIIHLSSKKKIFGKSAFMCSIPTLSTGVGLSPGSDPGFGYPMGYNQEWQSGADGATELLSMSMGLALKMHCIHAPFF